MTNMMTITQNKIARLPIMNKTFGCENAEPTTVIGKKGEN